IRPSPSGWLQPRMVARYGRVPLADGSINPCSSPVSSDPMIDALSTTMKTTPTCAGVLSGDGGFYSCVEGSEAKLFFQSDVSETEARTASSTVASRVMDVQTLPLPSTACALESTLSSTPPQKNQSVLSINNKTMIPVNLYWLNTSGVRQMRGTILPNQTWPQTTYNKYVWVVTDSGGTCLDIYVTKKEDSEVTLQ
ncbi:MAG: hypothetical protein MH252_07715, partial [Thermosynechococcaceae cyanobacterium MS004]|nr:hypothetical protein [Thermosynechococcaceae cyanobacterium MS004]